MSSRRMNSGRTGNAADKYHTPVYKDGMIFGVASAGRTFFCVDAKTGDKLWSDDTRARLMRLPFSMPAPSSSP